MWIEEVGRACWDMVEHDGIFREYHGIGVYAGKLVWLSGIEETKPGEKQSIKYWYWQVGIFCREVEWLLWINFSASKSFINIINKVSTQRIWPHSCEGRAMSQVNLDWRLVGQLQRTAIIDMNLWCTYFLSVVASLHGRYCSFYGYYFIFQVHHFLVHIQEASMHYM